MILLALQWGGSKYAWNSSIIIGLFVGFVATLAVFLLWENRRGDSAMVPFSIMRQRVVWTSCLVMMTQYGATSIVLYYLPVWFQTILGVSPILSGVYFLATAGTVIFVNVTTGIICKSILQKSTSKVSMLMCT
jgi:predicted MFS family arabinose efflux permease